MASTTNQPLPSFLPPDPKVEEPYLLTPRMAMRVAILGGFALIAFAVLFLRLWSLQILSPDKYRTAALNNQLRRDRIEAPRGTLVDRSGRQRVRTIEGHFDLVARESQNHAQRLVGIAVVVGE